MSDDRTRELLDQLSAGIAELTTSDRWADYLASAARFHNYSMGNVLLIALQCPHASRVAGFRTWQSMGRQVRKGEHGLRILAPCTYKRTEHNDATGEDVTRVGVAGFRSVAVFDVSQTDGEPLPEPVELLTGEDLADAYGRLERVAKGLGFSVADADYLGGANGVTVHDTRSIEILASNPPAQRVKTLAHEIGHAILHGEGFNYGQHRGLAELEAESVAYVVCATLGIASDNYSFGYVASWTGDKASELIKRAGDRIHKASSTILGALDAPEAIAA